MVAQEITSALAAALAKSSATRISILSKGRVLASFSAAEAVRFQIQNFANRGPHRGVSHDQVWRQSAGTDHKHYLDILPR